MGAGWSAGAVISLTLQWTKYGIRTIISLSCKCKLDGSKVRLRNSQGCVGPRLQMTGIFLARSSHARHSQFEKPRQTIIALSLEIIEIPSKTETSYTHSF